MKQLFIIITAILLAACSFRKETEYIIPTDIQGDKKVALLSKINKGKKLYQLYCSKCHGIFTKGKDDTPNFTDQQFDNYSAYAIKRDPKNHAVAANLNPEQLHEVIMFLKDRKIK